MCLVRMRIEQAPIDVNQLSSQEEALPRHGDEARVQRWLTITSLVGPSE